MAASAPTHPSPSSTPRRPTGWIEDDTFKKLGKNSRSFEESPEQAEARARMTGWQPSRDTGWNESMGADPSSHIHNALQHFGIGVDHEWYEDMMTMVDGRQIQSYTKAQLVMKLGIDQMFNGKAIDYFGLKDILSLGYLKRIWWKTYERHGSFMMVGDEYISPKTDTPEKPKSKLPVRPSKLTKTMHTPSRDHHQPNAFASPSTAETGFSLSPYHFPSFAMADVQPTSNPQPTFQASPFSEQQTPSPSSRAVMGFGASPYSTPSPMEDIQPMSKSLPNVDASSFSHQQAPNLPSPAVTVLPPSQHFGTAPMEGIQPASDLLSNINSSLSSQQQAPNLPSSADTGFHPSRHFGTSPMEGIQPGSDLLANVDPRLSPYQQASDLPSSVVASFSGHPLSHHSPMEEMQPASWTLSNVNARPSLEPQPPNSSLVGEIAPPASEPLPNVNTSSSSQQQAPNTTLPVEETQPILESLPNVHASLSSAKHPSNTSLPMKGVQPTPEPLPDASASLASEKQAANTSLPMKEVQPASVAQPDASAILSSESNASLPMKEVQPTPGPLPTASASLSSEKHPSNTSLPVKEVQPAKVDASMRQQALSSKRTHEEMEEEDEISTERWREWMNRSKYFEEKASVSQAQSTSGTEKRGRSNSVPISK